MRRKFVKLFLRRSFSAIEATFLAASEEAERQREQDELENERRLREAAEAAREAERERAEEAEARRRAELERADAEAQRRRRPRLANARPRPANETLRLRPSGRGNSATASASPPSWQACSPSPPSGWRCGPTSPATRPSRKPSAATDEATGFAESRRLAVLSDTVRPERLDLAMLLALAAAKQGDTLEARASLQRSLDARPEVVRFLHVPEGDVTSVAFGPRGQIAAGHGGGVVVFDARGERLRPAPLEVKEGRVYARRKP